MAIVRRNGLGDLILTLPLLQALKNEGNCSLTLFVDDRNASLVPYLPKIYDELIIFPKKGNKYFNILKIALLNRSKKFDVAISAKTSPMKLMNVFLFALRAKKRIAYVDQSITSLLINQKVLFDINVDQSAHQSLKAIKLIGYDQVDPSLYPKLTIPLDLKKKYPNPFNDEFVVYLSASTTNATSRIDPDKYARLINRLAETFSFSVMLLGQEKDEIRMRDISKRLTMPHISRILQNFDEFMVLQSYCDLYFVPDGGPAHIGAGLQKSQVVLFGSTSPSLWRPLSTKAFCLYHKEHVDNIVDDEIYKALCKAFIEVERGRVHVRNCPRCDSSKPISAEASFC